MRTAVRADMKTVPRRISSAKLARWYGQLKQSLRAGIDLPQTLQHCGGPPEKDRLRMVAALRAGQGVDEMLERAPGWLPFSDRLLLSAGAASGKLPEACGALEKEHEDLAENRRHLWLSALYPLLILHGAALMLPVAWAVSLTPDGNPSFDGGQYARNLLWMFGGTWGFLLLGRLLMRSFPAGAERLLRVIPLVGGYWRHRALARFAATLDALLEAGARFSEAVGGAALAVNDTRLMPAILALLPRLDSGQPLGALLGQVRAIPDSFVQRYQTAEQTGQLHHILPELAREHRGSAKRALFHIAFWYPKLLFLAAAVAVGISVAALYSEYLNFVLSLDP